MDLCLEVERTLGEAAEGETPAAGSTFSYRLSQHEVLIGRAEAADVRLPDAEVSLVHLRLIFGDEGWCAVDAGSANGTLLDGRQLVAGKPATLAVGARLRIAGFSLRVVPAVADEPITPRRTAELARAMVQEAFSAVDEGLPELEVLGGPLRGDRLRVELGESSLGRGEECTFCLPDRDASRRHALLRRDGAGVTIVDLGSKNGIVVQEQRVSGEQRLRHGDELRLGRTRLRFHDPTEALLQALAGDELCEPAQRPSADHEPSPGELESDGELEPGELEPGELVPDGELASGELASGDSRVDEPSVASDEPRAGPLAMSGVSIRHSGSSPSLAARSASTGATKGELWIVLLVGGLLIAGAVGVVLYLLL